MFAATPVKRDRRPRLKAGGKGNCRLMTSRLPRPGEIDPNPGPELQDPELERMRAEQAAERERESRESDENRFADQDEDERQREAARIVADVPEPRDED